MHFHHLDSFTLESSFDLAQFDDESDTDSDVEVVNEEQPLVKSDTGEGVRPQSVSEAVLNGLKYLDMFS